VLLMTPKSSMFGVILAVLIACAVSFVIASFFLKLQKSEGSLEEATQQMKNLKSGQNANVNHVEINYNGLKKIFVSCDAGMGSSAMGASMLRKKVKDAGLDIEVANCAINDLPDNARLVITHQDLTLRAKQQVPTAMHLSLPNFW